MEFVPVAEDVLVRTSRRLATTSTLVLGRRRRGGRAALLVDPAWEPDELIAIAAEVEALGARVVAGFATHAHHDHLLWHPDLGDVPRWATPTTARTARHERDRLVAEARQDARRYGGHEHPREVLDLLGRVTASGGPTTALPDLGGLLPVVQVVEHDGHVPGHAALWLPGSGVLVAGDMLSDVEPPLPLDEITGRADVATYRAGLERLAPFVARAAVLVPGHGSPTTDPQARLESDRRLLSSWPG
ncbi:MBL fold metallo-hydrolase [Isoptericola croceus]|uniref:MBL fold metallo-hydrolase n=1 Tax=Isoptericola croceus TaxID=3031406 RepID=UPI0023F96F5B|nr:MBL fold metallo-hydrolase [Isoptericola croceus]